MKNKQGENEKLAEAAARPLQENIETDPTRFAFDQEPSVGTIHGDGEDKLPEKQEAQQ
jgi:hypothetical protein